MLLVTGELSEHRGRMTDEQLRLLFKDLRRVAIPESGHMMHHEDPEAVARHIVEFERDCVSSAP
jgi:pimeloyl-ACP methyl ester carboxylesterase